MRAKACESCDLVMLALFVLIPPNCGLGIRTLQLPRESEDLQDAGSHKTSQRNLVFVNGDRVHLQFKTKKFCGRDEMRLKVNKYVHTLL